VITKVTAIGEGAIRVEFIPRVAPGIPVACTADWQSTDYTVDLPQGFSRDRPLTIEFGDVYRVTLPAAKC
jgi:hypothetical protein